MKRTILVLSVLLAMAGTAPASAAFGATPRLGESLLNTGIEQVAGDVTREGLPRSGGAWLRGASEFFVAPATSSGLNSTISNVGRGYGGNLVSWANGLYMYRREGIHGVITPQKVV